MVGKHYFDIVKNKESTHGIGSIMRQGMKFGNLSPRDLPTEETIPIKF